jgi:hypothetical protein
MGVDFDAFLGIGKRFTSESAAKDFLVNHTQLSDDRIDYMLDGGEHKGMSATCLDCYSGQDWFVGFEVGGDAPDTLINNVVDAHERWDEMVQDCPARVVHAVKVW